MKMLEEGREEKPIDDSAVRELEDMY